MISKIACRSLFASIAVLALAGCSSFDLRKGPSPVLDGAAVQAASSNKAVLLAALAADAGFGSDRAPDWYAVSEAGFNFVDDQCRAYFDNLFFLDRGRDQVKNALGAVGQTTGAILGFTGAAKLTLSVVAAAFGLASNATDIATSAYLYHLPPSTTQGFVEKLQLAFRDGAAANRARINSPTTAYYVIQRYLNLCLPPTIEAAISKQITASSALPVAAGGGALFSVEALGPAPGAEDGLIIRSSTLPIKQSRRSTVIPDGPGETRRVGVFEQRLNASGLKQLQQAACLPPDGRFTDATREAILAFLRSKNLKDKAFPNQITNKDSELLHGVLEDASGC